jgi:hypothetical protein
MPVILLDLLGLASIFIRLIYVDVNVNLASRNRQSREVDACAKATG